FFRDLRMPQPDSDARRTNRSGSKRRKAQMAVPPAFRSVSSTTLKLAALLVLTFGFLSVLWLILHSKTPATVHTGDVATDGTKPSVRAPGPAGVQPPDLQATVDPPGRFDSAKAPENQVPKGPHLVRPRSQEIERALLASNLEMPPVIERF